MFHEGPVLLSAMRPTQRQERLALSIAMLLFVMSLITLPFINQQLPRQDAFIPIADTILFLNDLITAVFLYTQFCVARSRGLLVLATGYLFTSLIIVPHLLTFPGVFSPTGLLGASLQTTVWLYIFWHAGLPPAVILYVVTKGDKAADPHEHRSPRQPVLLSIAVAAALTCALSWMAISGLNILPTIMVDSVRANSFWRHFAAPPIMMLSLTSLVLLWRKRSSVLDVWLLVVLWAWFIETALLSTTDTRFSMAWYAGRTFGLLSSAFVLLVILSESTTLYARLAVSLRTQDRERKERRMTMEMIVDSMAHELKQPLTSIVFNGEAIALLLIRSLSENDEARSSLTDILGQAQRASEIIASTKKMLAGNPQSRCPLDVVEIARETLHLLRLELRIHSVSARVFSAVPLPQVHGNRLQLLQVLVNLVVNAIDAMGSVTDRPRQIAVRCSPQANHTVAIEVEDSGTGIARENIHRIFDPFFTTKSHGTGLGLQICRSIVEDHGGNLTLAAAFEHGCTFRIVLPEDSEHRPV